MGFEDIVILDDSPDDLIQITNQEKVSFNETEKMEITLHPEVDYFDNGMASNFDGKQQKNTKFRLSAAELEMNNYCQKLNKNDMEKVICIVSLENLGLGIRCFRLSPSQTIADLQRLIDGENKHKESYLMTKENQHRYKPSKPLSDFGLNGGCIFFRFQTKKE